METIDMYEKYIKEVEGAEMVRTDHGFATYKYLDHGKVCYITEIFVVPESRGQKRDEELGDMVSEIAKSRECKYLYGSVSLKAKNPTRSMKMLIDYGMRVHTYDTKQDLMFFFKEL